MTIVLFVMADYGHDPTETAVPYREFKAAGFDVVFATEKGAIPRCDKYMLEGVTQKMLGATADACLAYDRMMKDDKKVMAWSEESFSFDPYDILFFPGGHEKSVRQVIESERVHSLLVDFWPSLSKKAVAAICHGVLVVAAAKIEGRSVLAGVKATTLPTLFENAAYYSTALFLGDYYKTFGAGTPSCEDMLKAAGVDYQSSVSPGPFMTKDDKINLLTGRYPADAELLAKETISLFV